MQFKMKYDLRLSYFQIFLSYDNLDLRFYGQPLSLFKLKSNVESNTRDEKRN